jgi:hypothetical protein
MWFDEPHPSPERSSPTRLSTLGQPSYNGWSRRREWYEIQPDLPLATFRDSNILFTCWVGKKIWLRNLSVEFSNMVLYWTSFNAYGHICITKVFDEWQLVGVALYHGFPNVNMRGNSCSHTFVGINPLPLLFKALLHGQKDHVFFSGHLNLRTTPETGLPSGGKKNHNN